MLVMRTIKTAISYEMFLLFVKGIGFAFKPVHMFYDRVLPAGLHFVIISFTFSSKTLLSGKYN